MHTPRCSPPIDGRPPYEQTDACEYITFTRFAKRAVIKDKKYFGSNENFVSRDILENL